LRKGDTFAVEFEFLLLELVADQFDGVARDQSALPEFNELRGLQIVVDDEAGARKALRCRTRNAADILRGLVILSDHVGLDLPGVIILAGNRTVQQHQRSATDRGYPAQLSKRHRFHPAAS